jgi:hypothetical protein
MSAKKDVIKCLIKYLIDVYNGEKIEGLSQSFFISNKELDKILNEYFIFFKNDSELISDVQYNYNLIKDISFPYEKGDFIYARDLSIENNVSYSEEQHNSYSHRIHSHLIKVFEEKLKKPHNFTDAISNNENPYPEYFNSYGYKIYEDFTSTIKKEIVLAEMSFLVDQLKKDGLMNSDKSLINIFNFMIEEFDTNFGTAVKFKSDYSPQNHLPLYKEIKKRYDIVSL